MKSILHQAIHLPLKPSFLMLVLIADISIVSCLIVASLPIMLMLKILIILSIFASSVYFCLRDALLMLPNSWRLLVVDTRGELKVTNRREQTFQPILDGNSFIHSNLVILNFSRNFLELGLPPIILLTGDASSDELRKLRVWLRWGKHIQHQDAFLAIND